VLLAIVALRQATKLPHLKVAAPEGARRLAFFQSKGQSSSPRRMRSRDQSGSHHRRREHSVREMDGYERSLFRRILSLFCRVNSLFYLRREFNRNSLKKLDVLRSILAEKPLWTGISLYLP
jgi:hypothetical protein